MRTRGRNLRTGILGGMALATLCHSARLASADTLNAVWNSATDVPIATSSYTASGNTVNFTLNFAPATGTDLMVVRNTGLAFIAGTFDNLTNGQAVALSYGGINYRFVANYYGGSGNDLVLVWASSRAFAWGYNAYGMVGDNTITNRLVPVPVTTTGALAGKTVVALAAGGNNDAGHSLALCSDGTVAAWGRNNNGQLGTSPITGYPRPVPVAVNRDLGMSALYGKTVVTVAAGWYHSLALCSDGTVAAWGANSNGQLGDNTTTFHSLPWAVNTNAGVSALYGKTVVAIAAGWFHSLALCSDGTVAAWGRNDYGQLGDNTVATRLAPVAVNTNLGVSALYGKTVVGIAAGWYHSLALCSDGTVAGWGANQVGQLGDNTQVQRNAPVAVNRAVGWSVLSNQTVVAIGAGGAHSVALCASGMVAAWGDNQYGELGDHTWAQHNVPVAVNTNSGTSALYGKTVVAVAAGATHNFALCSDGTLAGWGYNEFGQVGNNARTNLNAPVAVNRSALAASQRFSLVASGSTADHSLALVAGPPASETTLSSPQLLTNRAFRCTFSNTPGAFFSVLAATNPALPLNNWTSLIGLTELSPGQFQFTDPQATNTPSRFYRVRSP